LESGSKLTIKGMYMAARPPRVFLKSLKRYVALEIDVDFVTGTRAGGIDPRDLNLICPRWQNFEAGKEIRLIVNETVIDDYIERYRGVPGIAIIEGKDNINIRVKELVNPLYDVVSPALLHSSIVVKNIRIDDIPPTLDPFEQLRILYERGALGIRKREPFLLP